MIGVRNRYTDARRVMLLGDYWRIHNDLAALTETGPIGTAVEGNLQAALEILQGRHPDVVLAASYLSLADRLLLRLLADHHLYARCKTVVAELESAADESLTSVTVALRDADDLERPAALEAALAARHAADVKTAIEDSLQVRRLQHLLGYCGMFTTLLLFVAPLLTIPDATGYWSDVGTVAALMVVGAVGGLFSRLLQVRDGRASLLTYRTDMIKLGLSPLVGAMVSLILQPLASWEVVAVLTQAGVGGLALLVFAAGFSEKYFLRLLRLPHP